MICWLAFEKKPFQFWREIWIQVVVILFCANAILRFSVSCLPKICHGLKMTKYQIPLKTWSLLEFLEEISLEEPRRKPQGSLSLLCALLTRRKIWNYRGRKVIWWASSAPSPPPVWYAKIWGYNNPSPPPAPTVPAALLWTSSSSPPASTLSCFLRESRLDFSLKRVIMS